MSNTVNARLPQATGMRIIKTAEIPMNQIVSTKRGKNFARLKGIDMVRANQYANLILNNEYRPEYYIPPVVVKIGENKYRLVSGGHRLEGHIIAGAQKFYCVIVEFFDTCSKSAKYWEYVYQSNENDRSSVEVEKNYRKNEDCVSTIKAMVDDGIIADEESTIKSALEDIGFSKNSDTGKNLYNLVMASLGHIKGVTRLYNKAEINQLQMKYTTPNERAIVRTMKDSTGRDVDYDPRLVKTVINELLEHDLKVKALIHFNGLSPVEIQNVRPKKRNLIKTEYEFAKKFVELYESGEINDRVSINFLPQIEDDAQLV